MATKEAGTNLSASARRLVDAAEDLIGVHGVENVSNVHIAQAAGHRNKYAVQYHFGSREDLIRNIFDDRLSRINASRKRRLAEISAMTAVSVQDYVCALIMPMHEEVDAFGQHKYARFLARVMNSPQAVAIWEASDHSSSALETRRLIRRCAPHLSDEAFALRYELALEMITGAFRAMDRQIVQNPKQGAAGRETSTNTLLQLLVEMTTRLFVEETSAHPAGSQGETVSPLTAR